MIEESKKLENKISLIQSSLLDLPEGKLICTHNGKYYKWYHVLNHEQIYIPKKDRFLAEQLARKKYLSLLQDDLVKERDAILSCLEKYNPYPKKAEQLLNDAAYRELLQPYFMPVSEELIQWQKEAYDRNPNYQEQLIVDTVSGNKVRSKSEAMIDMILYTNKIPYRYECALKLGDTLLYPDFMIRHPFTGKVYYWEHFGMMDDKVYSQKVYSKLQLYTKYDIIPTIQLIITFETKQYPLSYRTLQCIVDTYFL